MQNPPKEFNSLPDTSINTEITGESAPAKNSQTNPMAFFISGVSLDGKETNGVVSGNLPFQL